MKEFVSKKEFESIKQSYKKISDVVYEINALNFQKSDGAYSYYKTVNYYFGVNSKKEPTITKVKRYEYDTLSISAFDYNSIQQRTTEKTTKVIDLNFLARMLNEEALDSIENFCRNAIVIPWNEKIELIFNSCFETNQYHIDNVVSEYKYYKDRVIEVREFNEKEYYADIVEYLEDLEKELNKKDM